MDDTQLAERLSAIAHQTRLRVFRLLVRAGPEGIASGEIARRIGAPATTMSTHLAVLARSGLITAQRKSRLVFYRLEPAAVQALMAALVSDCCEGRPELCSPLVSLSGDLGDCAARPAAVAAPTSEP